MNIQYLALCISFSMFAGRPRPEQLLKQREQQREQQRREDRLRAREELRADRLRRWATIPGLPRDIAQHLDAMPNPLTVLATDAPEALRRTTAAIVMPTGEIRLVRHIVTPDAVLQEDPRG